MMNLNRNVLQTLMNQHGEWGVSIYLPTHRNNLEVRQDALRLKNLLREAETQLQSLGMPEDKLRKMLRPARELLVQNSFWQHQREGLALFLTEEIYQWFALPIHFPELCVVTERFHLKPLLRWLTSDGSFHLLTLSQKHMRLYEGTRYSLTDITPEEMPQGLAEAGGEEEVQAQLQFRASAPAVSGRRAEALHGHSTATDENKHRLVRYFQQSNTHLHGLLKEGNCPLVVASVEYLQPIYREASHWSQLLPEGIHGNPERITQDELRKEAWALVHPHYLGIRQQAIELYQQLCGTGRTTDQVSETVTAASHGRIDTLFVPVGMHRWGHFDEAEGSLVMHPDAQPGAEDLLDLAALTTLSNGGRVFVVQPEQMPNGAQVAAIYRY